MSLQIHDILVIPSDFFDVILSDHHQQDSCLALFAG